MPSTTAKSPTLLGLPQEIQDNIYNECVTPDDCIGVCAHYDRLNHSKEHPYRFIIDRKNEPEDTRSTLNTYLALCLVNKKVKCDVQQLFFAETIFSFLPGLRVAAVAPGWHPSVFAGIKNLLIDIEQPYNVDIPGWLFATLYVAIQPSGYVTCSWQQAPHTRNNKREVDPIFEVATSMVPDRIADWISEEGGISEQVMQNIVSVMDPNPWSSNGMRKLIEERKQEEEGGPGKEEEAETKSCLNAAAALCYEILKDVVAKCRCL